jgi:RNA-directed DNA polymerase
VRSSHRYDFVPKRTGPPRLIEEPKPHTKAIQCKILDEILARVPIHDAAHGFLAGRSCITSVSRHACNHLVVAMDLKDLCPSTPVGRIDGLFRALAYPPGRNRFAARLGDHVHPQGRSFRASRPGHAMT